MSADFPCFVCGFAGPHFVIPLSPNPHLPEIDGRTYPPVIHCGGCQQHIWEPDTGDGVAEPNLTCIRPNLRDLAHTALEERNPARFLLLADDHFRHLLLAHNRPFLERLDLWNDVVLHDSLVHSTEGPVQAPPTDHEEP